jgi:tRNA-modifying protein YgfZ
LLGESAARASGGTESWSFGTAANSARISRLPPHETLSKTKMSNPIGVDLGAGAGGLGVLAFRGADSARFLHGQLSADVENLAPGSSRWAGLHNPQGRAIALLMLARTSPEEIFAVLPRELLADVGALLQKYVFRAKVRIAPESFDVIGAARGADPHGAYAFAWNDRQLLLAPSSPDLPRAADDSRWNLEDVRQGLPQVFAATRGLFVAQMLNLDLLGAVSFDKGCYTGQEVIARAHYRGRVKRRLQRWLNRSGVALQPGDAARGPDGRALVVVRGAAAEGAQEILAVGAFGPAQDVDDPPATDGQSTVVVSGPLPLPYSLPE